MGGILLVAIWSHKYEVYKNEKDNEDNYVQKSLLGVNSCFESAGVFQL